MHSDPLVRMANQIADFFRASPEAEAIAGTATHIRMFWDPRMRDGLKKILASGGGELNAIARAAAKQVCN